MTEDELKSIETDVETWAQGLDSAMVLGLVAEVRRLREERINVERGTVTIYTCKRCKAAETRALRRALDE